MRRPESVITDVMMLSEPVEVTAGSTENSRTVRRVLGYVVVVVADNGLVRGLPIQMVDTSIDGYKRYPIHVILHGDLNLAWSSRIVDYEPGTGVITTATTVSGVLLEPEEVVFVGRNGEPGERVVQLRVSSMRIRLIGPKRRATARKSLEDVKKVVPKVV